MAKQWNPQGRKVKPPPPTYYYKLATVSGSQQARSMEKALWEPLGKWGLRLFSIGHDDGSYDVMGDSGADALNAGDLVDARAVVAQVKEAC